MIRLVSTAAAVTAVGAGLWLATPSPATAHGGATGVVMERMELMKAMGESMKRLSAMLHGNAPYDAEAVRKEAEAIARSGGETLTKDFPEGSLHGPTEALPAIWEQPDRFRALAADLTTYAEALAAAADNGSATTAGTMPMHTPDMDSMMGNPSTQSMMGGAPSMHDMMGGSGGMMGGAAPAAADPQELAEMPPQAAFMQLTHTCSACHDTFRMKKD